MNAQKVEKGFYFELTRGPKGAIALQASWVLQSQIRELMTPRLIQITSECAIHKHGRSGEPGARMHVDNVTDPVVPGGLFELRIFVRKHADIAEARAGDVRRSTIMVNEKTQHEYIITNTDNGVLDVLWFWKEMAIRD